VLENFTGGLVLWSLTGQENSGTAGADGAIDRLIEMHPRNRNGRFTGAGRLVCQLHVSTLLFSAMENKVNAIG
jgi:hypothetical protein